MGKKLKAMYAEIRSGFRIVRIVKRNIEWLGFAQLWLWHWEKKRLQRQEQKML